VKPHCTLECTTTRPRAPVETRYIRAMSRTQTNGKRANHCERRPLCCQWQSNAADEHTRTFVILSCSSFFCSQYHTSHLYKSTASPAIFNKITCSVYNSRSDETKPDSAAFSHSSASARTAVHRAHLGQQRLHNLTFWNVTSNNNTTIIDS
jgi:hypothetical protein